MTMKFEPSNGYILISKYELPKLPIETSGFFVPEESKIQDITIVKVEDMGIYNKGAILAVETHMIEEVRFLSETFLIVPRTAVKGQVVFR